MYYRDLGFLELRSGKEAAAQFHKILDNPDVVSVEILRPLAHLGLARAYAATGDKIRASPNIGSSWHFGRTLTGTFAFSGKPKPSMRD